MVKEKTIGLIAAPGLGKKISMTLKKTLNEELNEKLKENINWNIEVFEDPLTGAAETINDLFSGLENYLKKENKDYLIALTDLPIYQGNKVVAIDINKENGISVISIPAYGWRPVTSRIKKTIISLVKRQKKEERSNKYNSHDSSKTNLLQKQFPIVPLQVIETKIEGDQQNHIRLVVVPRINGTLRLLTGMTFANNPMNMMRSLSNVVAIAFTTGAFGIIFTTMWQMSQVFSFFRLTITMVVAILSMVLWIIVAHGLLSKSYNKKNKRINRLYNLTTITTLLASVTFYYIIIFLLFLFIGSILLPRDFLGESLKLGAPAPLLLYIKIAWFAASISTVAGAIGAGLSNEKLVRESTYGYRQQQRYELLENNKK